jgi:ASC-1-like (ASCH) protein
MRNLVLHLKSCYFRQIKDGTKAFEYRLAKPYWAKRLIGQKYDRVIFWDAYKPGGPDTLIDRPYRGFSQQMITHEHFGPDPVEVFAI